MPRVSVITRTRDRGLLLRRAINSVLAQTLPDWELILVNDGGDPGALAVVLESEGLQARCGSRLQVIHHEQSLGMEAASNRGVRAARGELVTLLDDDDRWHPEFLAKTAGFLADNASLPRLGGVATHTTVVHEEVRGEGPAARIVTLYEAPFNAALDEISLFRMAAGNQIPLHSFVYRRPVFAEIGPYREDLPVLGDWEFNLRFLQHYEIAVLQEPLAYYHVRPALQAGSYSNTIIGGAARHIYYDNFLRNEALRGDLRAGRVGMGLLLGLAGALLGRAGVQDALQQELRQGLRRGLPLLWARQEAAQAARGLWRRLRAGAW